MRNVAQGGAAKASCDEADAPSCLSPRVGRAAASGGSGWSSWGCPGVSGGAAAAPQAKGGVLEDEDGLRGLAALEWGPQRMQVTPDAKLPPSSIVGQGCLCGWRETCIWG